MQKPNIKWLPISRIHTEAQVRSGMDKEQLQQLADDIYAHGLLQPIVVREHHGKYTVIAGHRRRFACEMAGLKEVPCIVGQADDDQVTEMQLAENLQREDLSAADVGRILVKLYAKHQSLDTVALLVNKSKPWVAKHIRFTNDYRAQGWIEHGLTEDIELANALSDLCSIDTVTAEKLIDKLKAGTLTRDEVRGSLAAAKAARAAEQRARPSPSAKKPAKKKDRSLRQLDDELFWGDKSITQMVGTWTPKERETFIKACEKAWDEGAAIGKEPHALAVAIRGNEQTCERLARIYGYVTRPTEKTNFSDVWDSFLKELQAFRAKVRVRG